MYRDDPFYESHAWERKTTIYTPYREIGLPKKYAEVNIYGIVICQSCESQKGWHKQVMEKVKVQAKEEIIKQIGYAKDRMTEALNEFNKRKVHVEFLESLKFD